MSNDASSELREELRDPETLSQNPDLSEDLGYELVDLDVIVPDNDREQVLIMPKDEEMLHDNMFIIAGSDTLVNLIDRV